MPIRRHVRRGVLLATIVCGFVALADRVGGPLHASGTGQPVVSHAIRVSSVLHFPGLLVVDRLGLRPGHHMPAGAWVAMLVVNVALYAAGGTVLSAIGSWPGRPGRAQPRSGSAEMLGRDAQATSGFAEAPGRDAHATVPPDRLVAPTSGAVRGDAARPDDDRPASPVRVTRRALLASGAGVVAAGAVGYASAVVPGAIEVTRRTVPLRDLPASLAGLRVVQLTDLHHGPWISLSAIRDVVARAGALAPDLVVLTGDYVHRSPAYVEPVAEALSDLRATVGVVAVLGNHDWWEGADRCRAAFARVGIPLIDNARRFVTPDRTLADRTIDRGLCVAGVGDYYEDEQRYADALGGVPVTVPRLLLSHNPDVAEDRAFRAFVGASPDEHRVDLMLSGHTHGGQIRLPGLGTPVVPSRYGQRYAAGWVQGPSCPVYVSRGTGMAILPLRLGVWPEIAVMELAEG